MEIMGYLLKSFKLERLYYLSNSGTLDSIFLINKKTYWKFNDKQYKNMNSILYSGILTIFSFVASACD